MTNSTYGHDLRSPRAEIVASLRGASSTPFWLDTPLPAPTPALRGTLKTDLLIVGGGFCGLWTALMAKERDPLRDVVLIEGNLVARAASGRNGGFLEASLTHGVENGERHFSAELAAIHQLALRQQHRHARGNQRRAVARVPEPSEERHRMPQRGRPDGGLDERRRRHGHTRQSSIRG